MQFKHTYKTRGSILLHTHDRGDIISVATAVQGTILRKDEPSDVHLVGYREIENPTKELLDEYAEAMHKENIDLYEEKTIINQHIISFDRSPFVEQPCLIQKWADSFTSDNKYFKNPTSALYINGLLSITGKIKNHLYDIVTDPDLASLIQADSQTIRSQIDDDGREYIDSNLLTPPLRIMILGYYAMRLWYILRDTNQVYPLSSYDTEPEYSAEKQHRIAMHAQMMKPVKPIQDTGGGVGEYARQRGWI